MTPTPPTSFRDYSRWRSDEAWAPVLPLVGGLPVRPQHPLADEVVDGGLRPGPGPAQVEHEHGDADVAEDLGGLEDRGLVRVELLGHGADVRLVADLDDGE